MLPFLWPDLDTQFQSQQYQVKRLALSNSLESVMEASKMFDLHQQLLLSFQFQEKRLSDPFEGVMEGL